MKQDPARFPYKRNIYITAEDLKRRFKAYERWTKMLLRTHQGNTSATFIALYSIIILLAIALLASVICLAGRCIKP